MDIKQVKDSGCCLLRLRHKQFCVAVITVFYTFTLSDGRCDGLSTFAVRVSAEVNM